MHGDGVFWFSVQITLTVSLPLFGVALEIDRSFFRDRIAGHVVQGRVAAVGFGAGFCGLLRGRFRLWVSSVAGITRISTVAGIPGIAGIARVAGISSIAGIPGVSSVATITSVASIAAVPAGGADQAACRKSHLRKRCHPHRP